MEQFKHYALAKYRGPSSKQKCPNCGQKTWKPYVDESGIPFSADFQDASAEVRVLAEKVGRCDNVRKCGWNYTPKMFFEETRTGVPKHRGDFKPPPPPEAAKPLRFDLVRQSFKPYASTFCCFLRDTILKSDRTEAQKQKMMDRLNEVLKDYWVGATKSHRICYWMIDINGQCRDGKFMAYKEDGHRDHDQHPTWARNSVIRKLYADKWITLEQKERLLDQEVIRPYFGTHLLADERYKDYPVGLVEGEKSCLLAAWACRSKLKMIWIACGMNTFNVSRLLPIIQQKRMLYIFPDVDQLDKWEEATKKLNYPKAYFMGKFILKRKKSDKDDTGDIFLGMILDGTFFVSGIDDPRTRTGQPKSAAEPRTADESNTAHQRGGTQTRTAETEESEEEKAEMQKAIRVLQLQVAHERLGLDEPNTALTVLFERLDLELVEDIQTEPDYMGF